MTFYYNPRPRKILQLLRIRAWTFDDLKQAMRCTKKTLHTEIVDLLDLEQVVHSSCGFMLTDKGMRMLHDDCYDCPHAGEKLCCGGAV